MSAVSVALQQVGKPYVYGAAGPDSFDCSGLVEYAAKIAYPGKGGAVPHSAAMQHAFFQRITFAQASQTPGALIYKSTQSDNGQGDGGFIHHVAMVSAPGQMVEAYTSGTPVRNVPIGDEKGWMSTATVGPDQKYGNGATASGTGGKASWQDVGAPLDPSTLKAPLSKLNRQHVITYLTIGDTAANITGKPHDYSKDSDRELIIAYAAAVGAAQFSKESLNAPITNPVDAITSPLAAINAFLARLTDPHTWLRILEAIIGITAGAVALAHLTGNHNPISKMAGVKL